MAYSCLNREPFPETLEMMDGYENSWLRHKVEVPFAFTRDCNYSASTLGQADQQCRDCTWRAKESEE